MARISFIVCILSALLVLSAPAAWADEVDDEGVTVEIVEEEQYHSPTVEPESVYLAEHFDDVASFKKRWIKSQAKKQGVDESIAKYDGVWEIQEPIRRILKNDLGLVLTTEAKHAAISTLLDRPFIFKDKPLVVQYEVTMQEGQNCGGAYLKLISGAAGDVTALRQLTDRTPYSVMFGPDKCGNDNKLHFIFRHRNPLNATYEEKHCKKPNQRLDDIYKDKEPHLYTLVMRPDNTFSISIDGDEVNSGSLLEDFTPPVNPPEEIDDPNDKKPDDWDDREKIVDPSAEKPSDWDEDAPAQIQDPNAVKPDGWLDDEPLMIPDPDAVKPSDWDENMDGEWEAPLVDNPLCSAAPGCGEWAPPTIPNPDYKMGVGFELWSMSPRLLFDNLIVTDDPTVAQRWAQATFYIKRAKLHSDSATWWGRTLRALGPRPGWWAAYVAYCAVPISAYVAYLVSQSHEHEHEHEHSAQDEGLDAKKTDAYVEDDPPSEGEHEAEPEPEIEPEPTPEPESAPRTKKTDLEPEVEEIATPDSTEESAEGAGSAAAAAGGGDGHRKRKPRRE